LVEDFTRQFEGTEIAFWLDESEIPLGTTLQNAIQEGIRKSDFFGIFLTPDSSSSDWVAREIDWAKEHGSPVVVIRLAKASLPNTILDEILFIDVTVRGFAQAREDLLAGLRRGRVGTA